jgi:hypothetical protein
VGKKKVTLKKEKTEDKNFFHKLTDSLKLVKNNKLLFLFVIILTIIYIGASVAVMTYYWVDAATHQAAVFNYIDSIPLDNPLNSPLGSDPLQIYDEINGVKNAFIMMGVYLLLLALLINGSSWLLVKLIRSKDGIIEFIKSYLAVFFVYACLFGLFLYLTVKSYFENAMNGAPNTILNLVGWLCLVILAYLYFISVGLATNSKLKEIPLKTLKNSIKIFTAFPTYILAMVLAAGFGYLINYFLEGSLFMLLFSIIMLFISIAYNKVLFSSEFE